MSEHDPVFHPSHYTQGSVECIAAIESALGPEGFPAFLRGQCIKYAWRLGRKGDAVEDAGKLAWYAQELRDYLSPPPSGLEPEPCRPITAEEVKRARDVARRPLSRLYATTGEVMLYATEYVDWDEAPEWASYLAIDGDAQRLAYWFEYRPEWHHEASYWRSGGQGGRIMYSEVYSEPGNSFGVPRLFERLG